MIERVRSLIPEEDRFHKSLLDFKNLYRAGLISEPEYLRRKKEEEEKEEESKSCRSASFLTSFMSCRRLADLFVVVMQWLEEGR